VISPMRSVVAPTVAQVDAADEGDVGIGAARVAEDDQLLVVRPSPPHPFVQQDLPAGSSDLPRESTVLLGAEGQAVTV
jgi:hypothetical protein